MSIKDKVFGWLGYKRSGTTTPDQWLINWARGGSETSSGARVNEKTALSYTPFWAAVRRISGTLAALPFQVYERIEDGKELINNHPVRKLLHDRPNEYMDSITFIESRQAHVLTYGNGYAEIQRDGAGRPIALWPLLPDRTSRQISKGGIPYYEVKSFVGGQETIRLPDYNVLHIKGLGFDGYTGYPVVEFHKEAIGYGAAVKEYGARFFGNGANPGGILKHPGVLSEKAAQRLSDSWKEESGGLSKAHRTRIIEEGMDWVATGVDPEKAQAIETQKFTVDDCSRIFNIPPHMLGSMDRATFSNIEEQNIDFYSATMLYWFRKWEQEVNYKLFMPSEQGKLFCEILVDALLRGNAAARSTYYSTGRQWGYLSINDIRRKENLNPIGPEGDLYLDPLNMKPAGTETPKKEGSAFNGSVEEAHALLIESQWSRIVNKQINALRKNTNGRFYEEMRDYAMTVMLRPVIAYASTKGIDKIQVKTILLDVINKNINKETRLETNDIARLRDLTIQRFNGDNNNA